MTFPSESIWTSTTDLCTLAEELRESKCVLILTHAKPDGDALGSTLALARSLERVGVETKIVLAGPLPAWVKLVMQDAQFNHVRTVEDAKALQPIANLCDRIVIVDTGSWSQLGDLRPLFEGRSDQTVIIDHHLQGDEQIARDRFISTSAASCTQVLTPLCTMICKLEHAHQLPVNIAQALYLGIATDTGWLRYSSVTGETLHMAGELIAAGVDHTALYRLIEQQDVLPRWKLLGSALDTLELHDAAKPGQIALMQLSPAEFKKHHGDQTMTNGFADMVLTIASVEVSVVLTEGTDSAGKMETKISMRSKPGEKAVDVNTACQVLGGGGHARAAGAKVAAPMREVAPKVLAALRLQMQ